MIKLDLENRLTPEIAKKFNTLYLALNDSFVEGYRHNYPFFGTTHVMTAKILWDFATYWAFTSQLYFQSIFTDHELWFRITKIMVPGFFVLNKRIQQLFRDWAMKVTSRNTYQYLDFMKIPFIKFLHEDLRTPKTIDQIFSDMAASLDVFEEFAQVLFFQALEETAADKLNLFKFTQWVNAHAISLNSEQWESDGLFSPHSKPRDLSKMREQLAVVFR